MKTKDAMPPLSDLGLLFIPTGLLHHCPHCLCCPCCCLSPCITAVVTAIDCCLFPQCFSSPQQCLSPHSYNSWPCLVSRAPHPPPCKTPPHPSLSSYSMSTLTAHAFSPWSSMQTVICPQSDASNPATANLQNSTTSTLSYSSQSSFRSSNAAPSPVIVISTANASPISHHHNWDTDCECERACCNTQKVTHYTPCKTESHNVHFPITPFVFLVTQC